VISTAHGLKFTEFKLKFHEGKIPGTTPSLENRIRTCKPEVGNVMDEIGKFLQLKG